MPYSPSARWYRSCTLGRRVRRTRKRYTRNQWRKNNETYDCFVAVSNRVAANQWFVNGAGDLVDPATGNNEGQNEALVKENIKQSIEAFEDQDRDGDDDEAQ